MSKTLLIALLLSFFFVLGISMYVAKKLLCPRRTPVTCTPTDYQLNYDDLSFYSKFDQILLKGWWIPAQQEGLLLPSTKTVIFAHGYGDSRGTTKVNMIELAKQLCTNGYNALLFDFRNSGDSEGNFNTVGVVERYDLHSAIDLARQYGSEDIALIGWSMGAATSIIVGEENQYVSTVIADSPFADLECYLKTNLPLWSKLPPFPFTPAIIFVLTKVFRIKGQEIKPEQSVKQYKYANLFLIHGTGDTTISHTDSEKIYNSLQTRALKDLWLPEGIRHIRAYEQYPEEYTRRVLEFLNQTLGTTIIDGRQLTLENC